MVAYIYRMVAKPGKEAQFIEAWKQVTLSYRSQGGAWGSRLHEASPGEYIAYARWPDSETRENLDTSAIEGVDAWRTRMRDACETVEELYALRITEDLLDEPRL